MAEQTGRSRTEAVAAVAVVAATLLGAGVAVAGSQGGAAVGGIPVFALCVAIAFAAQWMVFIPSFLGRTERFYDLTGSLTYVGVTALAVVLASDLDARSLLLAGMVVVWAARLGVFLVSRIRRAGHDDRFDAIKVSFTRFLLAWTVQALWISLTAGAALAAITTTAPQPLGLAAVAGAAIWVGGFSIEVVADQQKRRFRADPANRGGFIGEGLWAWSRHPNYFGEIVLWAGVALIALPVLAGWQLVTLVSPLFVALLLTRVSGIPMLERKADAKWGGQPDYEAYNAATPVLVPRPPGDRG
jgi:steroid 5-alpha reductase family enzyme